MRTPAGKIEPDDGIEPPPIEPPQGRYWNDEHYDERENAMEALKLARIRTRCAVVGTIVVCATCVALWWDFYRTFIRPS